jgi:hypothetical protein
MTGTQTTTSLTSHHRHRGHIEIGQRSMLDRDLAARLVDFPDFAVDHRRRRNRNFGIRVIRRMVVVGLRRDRQHQIPATKTSIPRNEFKEVSFS